MDLIHPQKKAGVGNHCGGECRGAKRIRAHLEYVNNKDAIKSRVIKWMEKNQKRYRQRISEYLKREDVIDRARQRAIEWRQKNPEKKRHMDAAFREANRGLVTSYKAARRARVRNAAPSWLTEEQWSEIRSVYAEARRLTEETGVQHEVDHIVPLQGRTVCGLHVPWNLRVLTREQNNRRPRVWVDE